MAKGKGGFIGQDGLNAPDAPTGVSGSVGDTQVTVSFTAPSDVGGSAITGYQVQSNNGDGTWKTSYDIANASYDNKSFSVASQETAPSGVSFKTDGTKMYVIGAGSDTVFQYSLSTAWDVSTASYDSVSFSVASQETAPQELFIKPDGTKLYVVGSVNDTVYQYSLSTAWDMSSASYDSVSFSVASQDTTPVGLFFKSDGTKMYVSGNVNDGIFQYSLSTAWNVSTASYDSVSLDVSTQVSVPNQSVFSDDGTKVFVADGAITYSVYQYNLTTAWDLSTGSYANVSFDLSAQGESPRALFFSSDGTKMYTAGTTNDTVYQYSTGQVDYPTASPVTVTGLTNGTSYTFNVWAINAFGWSSPSDASEGVSPAAIRALFGGGDSVSDYSNVIDYVSISTLGDASDFGDLTSGRSNPCALSSSTRGVWAGGQDGTGRLNIIDYVTIASTGNAADFGDLSYNTRSKLSLSNSTRGVFAGGYSTEVAFNIVTTSEYITIASTGNTTNFGNMYSARYGGAGCASPTRGIFGGGTDGDDVNILEYITISTTGNGSDFGDLTNARNNLAACSSDVRGVFSGGHISAVTNVMDYITIASIGNATDFGDLTQSKQNVASAGSNTRGLVAGGSLSDGTKVNVIEYFEIATTANSSDFGDLTAVFRGHHGCSSGHGGLQ